MELINFILALIVTFSGLIIGNILAFISPEELKPGKKYFTLFKKILWILIIIVLVYFSRNGLLFAGLILLFGGVLYFRIDKPKFYPYLVFPFFIGSFNHYNFIIQSSLIFLFGFPVGAMKRMEMKKAKKLRVVYETVKENIWFIILAIVLLLIF